MPNSKNKKHGEGDERTRSIPVKQREDPHYTLHILPAAQPHEVHRAVKERGKAQPISARSDSTKSDSSVEKHSSDHLSRRHIINKKVSLKFWRTLEWLATSALIFMALFFAMNFSAYFELFKLKLDQLRGTYTLSPYIEEMLNKPNETVSQELLPVTATVAESKQQVPTLDLSVAPPDDRIIIPRINKNVPVVNVKTENLLRRDWGALEKDIQESLRDGVVHYPGTAFPGQRGNVVLTGHSSYFAWDPGRFKDVFALLHEVVVGDTVIVYHDQIKYTYKVYETKVVAPDEVEILTQQGNDKLTLITCTPVGTNLRRLIVVAKPV